MGFKASDEHRFPDAFEDCYSALEKVFDYIGGRINFTYVTDEEVAILEKITQVLEKHSELHGEYINDLVLRYCDDAEDDSD